MELLLLLKLEVALLLQLLVKLQELLPLLLLTDQLLLLVLLVAVGEQRKQQEMPLLLQLLFQPVEPLTARLSLQLALMVSQKSRELLEEVLTGEFLDCADEKAQ